MNRERLPEAAAAAPPRAPRPKFGRPTRWLLTAGLACSFIGGLTILGVTLKSYYDLAHAAQATRAEDLAPGINTALLIGGPILALGIATTISGLVVRLVSRMLT
jgi:hypothetical protein